jgi:hypothetical protein
MRLADIEQALHRDRDFSVIEDAYLHRATLEDSLGLVRGRDRVSDARIAELSDETAGDATVLHDLGDMIVVRTPQGWREHRWAIRQGNRILSEIAIVDGVARCRALGRDAEAEALRIASGRALHPPLGELRSALGQMATPDRPDLPPGFPQAAVDAATRLHRQWNARDLSAAPTRWAGPDGTGDDGAAFILALLRIMPDAVLMIERACVAGDTVALLWRLHGHHLGVGLSSPPTGRRIRAIGSSVIDAAGGEDMMIDMLSIHATPHRPLVDYAA